MYDSFSLLARLWLGSSMLYPIRISSSSMDFNELFSRISKIPDLKIKEKNFISSK